MRYRRRLSLLWFTFFALAVVLGSGIALAENIDPNNDESQYAYGEKVGWLNTESLGDGGSGVEVEDFKLTGYIWAENVGWISLSCQNVSSCGTVSYRVINNGVGTLSGYAWGENVGWISFSCKNTDSCDNVDYGVSIDPFTGVFLGYAWGENIGWISFKNTGPIVYKVKTAWWDNVIPGDIDDNAVVDLIDAILALKICVRLNPSETVHRVADINGDRKIGSKEVQFILQKVSGLR